MKYPLAANTLGPEEIAAAKAVLDSGYMTMGTKVKAFEEAFARWTGAKHAVMVNSGSSANLLMVDAMLRRSTEKAPWEPGDEILVPALAWPTTVWPLVQLGLKPVFVDVDPKTFAIDVTSAKKALSSKTKGMFLIHVLGLAADMKELGAFCLENGLTLLEDSCESLGAFFNSKHVGNFGPMASFSTYFSHHISTIEGGMIITSDEKLYDDLKSLRAHGWVRDRSDKAEWEKAYPQVDTRFMFIMPGYNVRPTEVQAAIGLLQLEKLETMIEARENLARRVQGWIQEYAPWVELFGAEHLQGKGSQSHKRRHSWMTFPMMLSEKAPCSLKKIKEMFHQHGVDTRPIIAGNLVRHPAIHKIPYRAVPSLQNCDRILERGFMIGCHPVVENSALEALEKAFRSLATL